MDSFAQTAKRLREAREELTEKQKKEKAAEERRLKEKAETAQRTDDHLQDLVEQFKRQYLKK